jgi:dihydroorotase
LNVIQLRGGGGLIVDIVLSNARAYVDGTIAECSIAINEGTIFRIGRETNMPKSDARLDMKNLLVLPGLIDAHVHLRDEGKAYKEDFYSGTAAAAAGGMTTVLDMPNNEPVTMSFETLEGRMKIAGKKVLVNVGFYSAFPRGLNEIEGIVRNGAIGFKLYMAEQIGGLDIHDDRAILEAFRKNGELKILTAVHAEDDEALRKAEGELKRANRNDIDAFLSAHSEQVEVRAVERLLRIAWQTKMHLHLCHMTTQDGLKAVIAAKNSQMPLTCEATPHHLFLSEKDLKRVGALAVTMPPVRKEYNVEALWEGLRNGSVDVLVSDHAPHAQEEKEADTIWDVKVGIPGLETTLSLLLSEVHRGRLSIGDIVRLMAENPARVFGLKAKGALKVGNDADLTVIDPNRQYKIDPSKFYSKAKYSPFEGRLVKGKAAKTFAAGHLVMDDGEIVVKAGTGRVLLGR